MQTAYRDDTEAAAAQIRTILEENTNLRGRVRALESQVRLSGAGRRRAPWILLGVLLGTLGAGGALSLLLLTTRCAVSHVDAPPAPPPIMVPSAVPQPPSVPAPVQMPVSVVPRSAIPSSVAAEPPAS